MTQPPSNSNQLPALLLLLFGVFPPAAAAVTFAEQLTQNPWQMAGWVALYWAGLFVFGSIMKIWQRLEKGWLDSIANWVDSFVRRLFSGYRKRYLQHLIYRHRSFDVKGLGTQGPHNLMLQQVFVELGLAEQPIHIAPTSPIGQMPEDLRTGRHTIWEYLASAEPGVQHLAIIGAPGSGKSTLLKHLTLVLTARRLRRAHQAPNLLPVLLAIRDHSPAISNDTNLILSQTIANDLVRTQGPVAPPQWFERELERGRCLILLDGLDEVADQAVREKIAQWIECQMRSHGKNRFIVTSRPLGYQTAPLAGVSVITIRHFTPRQVERFVHNWYLANELMSSQKDDPGVRMTARQGAEDLLQRLRNAPTLAELAVNPLLLTMIANVHRFRSSLPGRRVELYAEICEVFLGKRRQAQGMELDLTPSQKQSVLQVLAYHLMRSERRELPLEEILPLIEEPLALVRAGLRGEVFLKQIEEGSGLLLERERDVYSFAHLTFQEYLAATHIREHNLEHELTRQVNNSWWRETILLYVAQADATTIVAACLNEAAPSIAALTLALDCRDEAKLLQPQLQDQLAWVEAEGVEDQEATRRSLIAEVLLARRIRHMIRIDEQRYVDPGLITHAEYQLFLDAKQAESTFHQPDHWQSDCFPVGQGLKPVVGVRPSDAEQFCAWLTQRNQDGWQYRIPRITDTLPTMTSDKDLAQAVGYWTLVDLHQYHLDKLASGSLPPELALRVRWANDMLDVALLTMFEPSDPRATILFASSTEDRALALDLDRASALASALDLASDRALDLANGRVLTLDLASALASALASVLANALALASALDLDLTTIHTVDLTSTRTLDLALASARALAFDLASDLDRALVSASARTLDLAAASAGGRTLNLDLALDLASDLDRARTIERVLGRVSASDLDLALDRARVLDRAIIVSITSGLSTVYQHVGERAALFNSPQIKVLWRYARPSINASKIDQLLALHLTEATDAMLVVNVDQLVLAVRELDRTRSNAQEAEFFEAWSHSAHQSERADIATPLLLETILSPYIYRTSTESDKEQKVALQWMARLILIVLINMLSAQLPEKTLMTRFIPRNEAERVLQQRIAAYLNIYIQISLLEERRSGEVSTVEGIRIVREYLEEPKSSAK